MRFSLFGKTDSHVTALGGWQVRWSLDSWDNYTTGKLFGTRKEAEEFALSLKEAANYLGSGISVKIEEIV